MSAQKAVTKSEGTWREVSQQFSLGFHVLCWQMRGNLSYKTVLIVTMISKLFSKEPDGVPGC